MFNEKEIVLYLVILCILSGHPVYDSENSCHRTEASAISDWKKVAFILVSKGTNQTSRLQLTTSNKGVIWFDQVSVMPLDTYKVNIVVNTLF